MANSCGISARRGEALAWLGGKKCCASLGGPYHSLKGLKSGMQWKDVCSSQWHGPSPSSEIKSVQFMERFLLFSRKGTADVAGHGWSVVTERDGQQKLGLNLTAPQLSAAQRQNTKAQ